MQMKEGGKLQAFITSELGYGPNGHRVVPPNSISNFCDLELLAVTNQPPPVRLAAPWFRRLRPAPG